MPHWVYAGIHLYLHLPAIHAYTYSNCNSHSDTYGQTNTHAQARGNTEDSSHPAAAPRCAEVKDQLSGISCQLSLTLL